MDIFTYLYDEMSEKGLFGSSQQTFYEIYWKIRGSVVFLRMANRVWRGPFFEIIFYSRLLMFLFVQRA